MGANRSQHTRAKAATASLLSLSERRLLGLIHRAGRISQAEATRLMQVGQPMVSRLVTGLAAKGMVTVGPPVSRGRGQPSAVLSLRPDHAFGLGVSLLGDSVSLSLVDFCGQPRWHGARAMPAMSRDGVSRALRDLQRRALEDTGVDPLASRLPALGVSAFFIGDGPLMNPPPLLDDWALIDIAPILSESPGLPVRVDNDGNVACLGESLLGAGRRFRSFAYFQITNGFGGGLVLDGAPYRGSFGNAGEFAAVWQAAGIEHPNLERLRHLMARQGQAHASVSALLADFDIDAPGVEAWLEEAAPAFSLAATAAAAVADCEAIVLGGRLPRLLAERLGARIIIAGTDRRARPRPLPVVTPSEVEGDAVSLGAAMLALQPDHFA